jgi:hypothetical protein
VDGEGATFTVTLRRAVTEAGEVPDRGTVEERRGNERDVDEQRAAEDRRS